MVTNVRFDRYEKPDWVRKIEINEIRRLYDQPLGIKNVKRARALYSKLEVVGGEMVFARMCGDKESEKRCEEKFRACLEHLEPYIKSGLNPGFNLSLEVAKYKTLIEGGEH